MKSESDLEILYQQGMSALKAKDYSRAAELLQQILAKDENYKDASRLLAQAVKLKRRRWYNHPLLWGGVGAVTLVILGFLVIPRVNCFFANLETPQTSPSTPSPTPTTIPISWKRLYPGQEFSRDTITKILVDPNDPDVIYVAMVNAGIYKSINGGESWKPENEGLPSTRITSLIFDPVITSILYAVSRDSGLYKTHDGGEHWQLIYEEQGLENVYSSPDNKHLYLTFWNAGGLLESNNNGITWQSINTTQCPARIGVLKFNPIDPIILFASDNGRKDPDCAGVYQSTDGGQTWAATSLSGTGIATMEMSGNYIYAAALRSGDLFVSSDAGQSWVEPVTPNGNGCDVMFIDSSNAETIYCGEYLGNALMKGTYGGKNWQQLDFPELGGISALSIEPISGDVLVGGIGLILSADGGSTWERKQNGLGGRFIEVKLDPMDPAVLYAYEGPFFNSKTFPLYRTQDRGITWNLVHSPPEASGIGLTIDAAGTLFRFIGNRITYSLDGGATWGEKNTTNGQNYLYSLAAHPYQAKVFLALFFEPAEPEDAAGLFFSEDDMQTWVPAYSNEMGPDWCHFSFDHGQGQVVYAGTSGNVFRSNDGGRNFVDCAQVGVSLGGTNTDLAIDQHNSSRLFIATRGRGVLVSIDDCMTWQTSNTGLKSLFVNTLAIDPNQLDTIYAGTDGGAYISYDSGESWNQISDGLLGATVVYSIVVDKDSNVYASTPYGVFILGNK